MTDTSVFFSAIAPEVKEILRQLDTAGRPGLPYQLVMAQAAIETGWSAAGCNQGNPGWRGENNLSGISVNGKILNFSTKDAYVSAYVRAITEPAYKNCFVESTTEAAVALGASKWRTFVPLADRAAVALGADPWAGSHYELPGGIPGSALEAVIGNYAQEMAEVMGIQPAPQAPVTVEPGQTLDQIAQAHDLTAAEIEEENPQISNPNYIVPGERLTIEPVHTAGKLAGSAVDTENRDQGELEGAAPKAEATEGATEKTVEGQAGAQITAQKPKSMANSDTNGTRKNVPDVAVFGDGDTFALWVKASSQAEGWMKTTKVANLPTGCLIQAETQQRNPDGSYALSQALVFVHGIWIDKASDPPKLVFMS